MSVGTRAGLSRHLVPATTGQFALLRPTGFKLGTQIFLPEPHSLLCFTELKTFHSVRIHTYRINTPERGSLPILVGVTSHFPIP